MIFVYRCTNANCEHETTVRVWPATRYDPEDSTWGDGCSGCGAELNEEPVLTEAEMKAEAELARAEQLDDPFFDSPEEADAFRDSIPPR